MTTKQNEIKIFKTVYVATDGTEFNNDAECLKYEQSALGVLRGKLSQFRIKEGSEADIYGQGSEENTSLVLQPKTKEDIDVIRQVLFLCRCMEGYVANLTDEQIGRIIILTFSYEDSDAWFDTLDDIVERMAGDSVSLSY